MIEVEVAKLMMDEGRNPVVILKEVDGNRILPIWIASSEANAIGMALAGQSFQRPLTHDLLATMVRSLEATLVKVLIAELQNNTFFATLLLHLRGEQLTVDARPSDSIALALRLGAPVFVAEKLLAAQLDASEVGQLKQSPEERAEELKRYVEQLRPEDFGKFQM